MDEIRKSCIVSNLYFFCIAIEYAMIVVSTVRSVHPLVINKVFTEILIHLKISHQVVPIGIELIDGGVTEIVEFVGKRNLPETHFINASIEALAYDEPRSSLRDSR